MNQQREGVRMKTVYVLAALLFAATAQAQAAPIDKWTLRLYLPGATLPLSSTDLLAANVSCGLPAPLTGSTINPDKLGWDNPMGQGFCRWDDPGTGVLNSLPIGATSYDATLTATSGALVSPESAKATFTHPGVAPATPTGFRAVR